jgi:hypothetical protein
VIVAIFQDKRKPRARAKAHLRAVWRESPGNRQTKKGAASVDGNGSD